MLPQDPFILLSYVNTKLRDEYETFQAFCVDNALNGAAITKKLATIGYCYDEKGNRFA